MTIGEKIKKLRKEKDLPQTKFSEMIGIHLNHLRRCEAGESMPSAEIIQKICKTFKVSADYLLLDGEMELSPVSQISDKELLKKFESIQTMSEEDIKTIKSIIDTYILKYNYKKLSESE